MFSQQTFRASGLNSNFKQNKWIMNEVFLDKLENRENQECENKNADKIISPTLALREKKINVY